MQQARLIPVSGIGSKAEAEQRATSALLAVMTVVRDLSLDLLSPLGASRAHKATVEAYTEVVFNHEGRKVRPDGLIRVTYGNSVWSALVEVKTGTDILSADQVNAYWDVARTNGIDQVLTISNEIAPADGIHPTAGLKVRSNSKVGVHHLSWSSILATAIRIKEHRGVDDPEQAWILSELIRYLQHDASGALAFDDMGPFWVAVRDGARAGTLTKRTEGVEDICLRWDQLIRYLALRLSAEIGSDVTPLFPKTQRDPKTRAAHLLETLTHTGILDGTLRIPNTVGDLEVIADLRGQNIATAVEVTAPQDRGAKGRVTWLVHQLKDAAGGIVVETFPKNARTPVVATVAELRDDRNAALDDQHREPYRFRIVARTTAGAGRKSGTKTSSFIDSVLNAVNGFYGSVVQDVTPWQPPAPKLKRDATAPTPDANNELDEGQGSEASPTGYGRFADDMT